MGKLARMRIVGVLMAVTALCATLATAGCGSSDSPEASAKDSTESGLRASPPEIEPGPGIPPKKLVVKDMQVGTGKEAKKGDEVKVQYYGVDWRSGVEHANSWNYTEIPVFELGSHRLLRGLNLAIPGMKEGGSREVTIPYNLVYYPGGHHRPLGPLDALIYKVYLVEVLDKGK
jgi:peptidylprolyl isomerase